jgi:hypothetical protein
MSVTSGSKKTNAATWTVVGASVRGAAHARSGLPNQDAIAWTCVDGELTVLALSDGHGSAKYFRSDVGARLAVDVALDVVPELLRTDGDAPNASAAKRIAESSLGQAIVRRWGEAVDADVAARPIESRELDALEGNQGSDSRLAVESDPRLAYGATLLAVLATDALVLFFQIGDGDILVVGRDGTTSRPLPRDPRLFANETTSLCTPAPWRDARVAVQVVNDRDPALVLLTTDGYPNSFGSDDDFVRAGADVLTSLMDDGVDSVGAALPDWLAEATAQGSGDDATVGLLWRASLAHPLQSDE